MIRETIPIKLKYQEDPPKDKRERCAFCNRKKVIFSNFMCRKCWLKNQPNLFKNDIKKCYQ